MVLCDMQEWSRWSIVIHRSGQGGPLCYTGVVMVVLCDTQEWSGWSIVICRSGHGGPL